MLKLSYNHLIIILFLNIIKTLEECPMDKPDIMLGQHQSLNCFKEGNDSIKCQIKNNYIKIQLLSNIINIGKPHFNYLTFAPYSNGDMMIFETSGFQNNSLKRIFYVFKKNETGFFPNNIAEESFSDSINEPFSDSIDECESGNIINSDNNINNDKEYLFSISKENSYEEIYDFENNNNVYYKHITNFKNISNVYSFRNTFVSMNLNSTNNSYLIAFIGGTKKNYSFFLQIHKFDSIENFTNETTLIQSKEINEIHPNLGESIISCFQTIKRKIMCFYYSEQKKYIIIAYNETLEERYNYTANIINNPKNPFYKCIHLKEEVGIFAYYSKFNNEYYPILRFKEYQENTSRIINYTLPDIILNKAKALNSDLLLNDIIKIKNDKICFCSTDKDKQLIYIILINLFNNNKYKIRYYSIQILNFYKFQIHKEIKIHNYNSLITFAFSYQNKNNQSYYNALMIFSYPNSTDKNFSLYSYFFESSNINNINIDLKNEVRIENNIFGYIFSGIKIQNLTNCENINLTSNLNNKGINSNYTLKKNEILKLKFKNYDRFYCNLFYRYIITEPELEEYDKYPYYIDEYNESSEIDMYFNKEEYIGRLTYYNIFLNESLSNDCKVSNCNLCLKNNRNFCIVCKYNFTSFKDGSKNCLDNVKKIGGIEIFTRELKQSKEELIKDIDNIINSTEIGKNYEMKGEDYTMIIKPTNSTSNSSSTHVDFSACENILRSYYNISNSRIITFLQLEIDNLNSQSLVNQVGYQAFDDKRNPLNLTLCNNTNIQIFYSIKSDSNINFAYISSFKDSNIDIFNISDNFFTDICTSYSDSDNDVILEDRIKDYYQNYSLCDEGCTYNEFNLEYMTITCNCSVKENLTINQKTIDLTQYGNIDKSSMFSVMKCYKYVFSLKNKLNNIGFLIFLFIVILHIPIIIIYFYKGLKSIKNYLAEEMIEYGYINNIEDLNLINKNEKDIIQEDINNINSNKKKIKKKHEHKTKIKNLINPPPKNKNTKNKIKEQNFNKKNDNSTTNRIKLLNSRILEDLNNIKNEGKTIKFEEKNNIQNDFINNEDKNISLKFKKKVKKKKKNNISILPTETKVSTQNSNINQKKRNIIDLNLININLNKPDTYKIKDSNYVLNIYTFEEAIKNDLRSLCAIFYIYLLAKQAIFHAFLFWSPLEIFPLRFSLLLFVLSCDLALNAIFYFDDKISEKYRYAKGFLLFAFSNNITVILLSTLIGFILLTLVTKLVNSTNSIRDIFRKEEEQLKNDKNYIVTEKRKALIIQEINKILKMYKIKVIIFFVIELILILFFWYYVTAFCEIYSSTQKSWLWDSFLSIISRIIIDLLLCLGFAKLYRIGVESNFQCIYKIAIFFYCFW